MKSLRTFLLSSAVAAAVLACSPLREAHAYRNPGQPSGFVNDFTRTLSAEEKQALEGKVSSYEQSSGNEIAVAVIPTVGDDTIENYATRLFEDWKIGKEGKDNGALLLVARDDRKIRIEVGYGLEPALTDIESKRVIDDALAPAFAAGQYYRGLDLGVDAMIQAIGSDIAAPSGKRSTINFDGILWWGGAIIAFLASILGRSRSFWLGGVLGALFGGIAGLMFGSALAALGSALGLGALGLLFDYLVSRHGGGKGGGPWIFPGGFGGRGGGGFGGFGGGRSGGGGASGGW